MNQDFVKYFNYFFKSLIQTHGFQIKDELYDGQTYIIESGSASFGIELWKYHGEFNTSLYKLGDSANGVALFNLLDYLRRETSDAPESKYFRNEKDIQERYKKQLNYIATVINDNYVSINDFFNSDNYESEFADLEKFIIKNNPDLYGKIVDKNSEQTKDKKWWQPWK